MPQFFLPPESLQEKTFHLTGPEAFHITKVLRYQAGHSLVLFDGKGGRFEGVIREIGKDGSVRGELTGTIHRSVQRPPVEINLYQGLLKATHWDWVVEKSTELGVACLIPVMTPRTVVLLREEERAKAKQERWTRLMMAAAKQCGLSRIPRLKDPMEFRDAIKLCSRDAAEEGSGPVPKTITLLAWEGLSGATAHETLRLSLRHADQERGADGLEVNIFIGPEGGFTEEEIELAESMGAVIFGLGPRILRADTAALAAVSLVQYEFGCM